MRTPRGPRICFSLKLYYNGDACHSSIRPLSRIFRKCRSKGSNDRFGYRLSAKHDRIVQYDFIPADAEKAALERREAEHVCHDAFMKADA